MAGWRQCTGVAYVMIYITGGGFDDPSVGAWQENNILVVDPINFSFPVYFRIRARRSELRITPRRPIFQCN